MPEKPILIGGHDGVEVFRVPEGVLKVAHGAKARARLANEANMLRRLTGRGVAAEVIAQEHDSLLMTDLGQSEPVQTEEALRRSAIRLLWELRKASIRHGDATDLNTIIRDDRMMLLDFEEARLWNDPRPDKREDRPDSYFVWLTVAGTADTSRIVRRWAAIAIQIQVHRRLGKANAKTLLDLGCYVGDMTAMARAEGMDVLGIDRGDWPHVGFDSIAAARSLWGDLGCEFEQRDVVKLPDATFGRDVVLLLSTWAYIVRDHGRKTAIELLERIIARCGALFFEPHLLGDGPGPDFLESDQNVARLLAGIGAVAEPVVTLPVAGRDATRTVWQVRKA